MIMFDFFQAKGSWGNSLEIKPHPFGSSTPNTLLRLTSIFEHVCTMYVDKQAYEREIT
jgi:hypothetical protein